MHVQLVIVILFIFTDGPDSVTLLPPDTQYNVTEGSNVININCTADCRPTCNYMWSGPNVPSGTTNVLILENIQQNHTGVFNCTATNKIGRMISSNVNLNVKCKYISCLLIFPA